MAKYKGSYRLGAGFEIVGALPIDDRVEVEKLSTYLPDIVDKTKFGYVRLYDGLEINVSKPEVFGSNEVYCISKRVSYVWREGKYGAISGGFLYPNFIVDGFDYTGRVYNYCVADDSVNVGTTLAQNSTEILIHKDFLPVKVLDGKVANIMMLVAGDDEYTMPGKVEFTGDNMIIHVKPAYAAGTFLNIRIS